MGGTHAGHQCVTPASVDTPPTPAPSPTDNLHQECWDAGGCRNDGAAVCEWCGEHGGVSMYCCRQDWPYSPGHKCYNAGFGTHEGHHCVTPASVDTPPTPAPSPAPTPVPAPALRKSDAARRLVMV